VKKAVVFLVILMFNIYAVRANDLFIGIKFFGLSTHPTGALNTQYMPLKFDKRGTFVLNLGVELCIEYFIYEDIVSVKFIHYTPIVYKNLAGLPI
jgi:hypothetical protein